MLQDVCGDVVTFFRRSLTREKRGVLTSTGEAKVEGTEIATQP